MAAAPKINSEGVFQGVLMNYLVSQARTVEATINRALSAVLDRNERLASEVFLTEPRINEMEIVIDEHAVRLLRQGNLLDTDVRLIVASLKINNDLERMGDLAVNLGERAVSLAAMGDVQNPVELEPMTVAVRAMVSKCLGRSFIRTSTSPSRCSKATTWWINTATGFSNHFWQRLPKIQLLPLPTCNLYSLPGTSSVSPITPPTSPRTFCLGSRTRSPPWSRQGDGRASGGGDPSCIKGRRLVR